MFYLYTSSKFEFSLKVKVMGLNLGYLLKNVLLYFAKPVYGPFGMRNMYSTLDFRPRPARKETNVPLNKRS